MDKPRIFIIMGVSGCGKSTIGISLANTFKIPFFDGDDFHPEENVAKMSQGHPLNDIDRQSWLLALNKLARKNAEKGAVIACSALKETYRDTLKNTVENILIFVYLEGTFEEINQRMKARKGHFMPPGLLKSQFETLQPPKNAINVSIRHQPEEIVQNILKRL